MVPAVVPFAYDPELRKGLFLPGEGGNGILEERERSGIPLARGTWDRLLACARQLGVAAPQTMQNVV
jgi:LDH2 family malate/lactate/ureidoglycolate dehydrogenase